MEPIVPEWRDTPMKKISLKKLSLSRETLLALDSFDLQQAVGGLSANTDCTYTNCCSGMDGCGTRGASCTSRLC
jgi:hypothetical protein